MPLQSHRSRPALEALEGRLTLSSSLPADTLSFGQAVVASPGAVGAVSSTIVPKNLAQHKSSTVIGLDVEPAPGSSLIPQIVSVTTASGQRLPIQPGQGYVPGVHPSLNAYVAVSQPGPLTVDVTGQAGTTGSVTVRVYLPGDVTGDGRVTLADVKAYSVAYLSNRGQGFYNPAADANSNGFVGQNDGRLLERNLSPLSPEIPLSVDVHLPFNEVARATGAKTSGAVTRLSKVTVIGHTTPGSLVFTDSGLANFAFNGKALPTNAQGYFSYTLNLKDELTNTEYLVISPFGQQTIRSFPVLRID